MKIVNIFTLFFIILQISTARLVWAQAHKGISFQGVIKLPSGETPTRSGITVNAKILSSNDCVLREEQFLGVNISNGYISIPIGKGAVLGYDPGLILSEVMDNSKIISNGPSRVAGLACLDANGVIDGGVTFFNPATADGARKFRLSLTLDSVPVVADFNMRSMAYAVNSETLNGKKETDLVNINNAKSVTQANVESIFERFTKLDAILNNSNGSGTSLGVNITGSAATATTATNVTGTVAIANGGTGAVTASGARTNLGLGSLSTMTPTGTGDATTYLRGDGTWAAVSGGGGAVSSVAGRTGAVTLSNTDISGLGPLAILTTSGTADSTKYLAGDGSWTAFPSTLAPSTSFSGDVSGAYSSTSVDKIKGQNIGATATTEGQVLRYVSGSWHPSAVKLSELAGVSGVIGSAFNVSSCGANQTMAWSSLTDSLTCQEITISSGKVTGLAAVASSGSYNDLANTPTIPAAQVNADWSAVAGLAQILNKPTLGALASKSSIDLSGAEATGVIHTDRLPASAKYWSTATGGINYSAGRVGVGTTTPAASVDVRSPASYSSATALTGSINSSVTTISVGSTAGYPATGVLLIDNELVSYTGLTGTSFTGLVRGFSGSAAAAHTTGALVEILAIYTDGNVRAGVLTSKELRIGSAASTTVIDAAGTILPGTTIDSEGDPCTVGGAIVRDADGEVMVCAD